MTIFHSPFCCSTLQLCFGQLALPEWRQSWWDCQSRALPSSGWWFGIELKVSRAPVFSMNAVLSGLRRAVGAHSPQLQHPKVGSLPSCCFRTAWFLPFLEIFRLFFNSVCYSIFLVVPFFFPLTRFSFYCSQPRNPKRYKTPFPWTTFTPSPLSLCKVTRWYWVMAHMCLESGGKRSEISIIPGK